MENLIWMKNIVKKYNQGKENELTILKGISLNINKGEFVSIVGESGSGKSTLMNIMGALDTATSGTYYFEGVDVNDLKEAELTAMRNKKIGFVYQHFNLIPRMSAKANVEIPMMYSGMSRTDRTRRSMELLKLVGMDKRADHTSNELSGGQKQRIAIARALSNNPSIIFADEPTGALDIETTRMIMDLFHMLHKERGVTIVLITHSKEVAAESGRIITIADGQIV